MNQHEPHISIIVPCYNQARYLDETLQSVLKQSFQKWECILVNDGSTDNTKKVAQKWLNIDNRFKYYFQENSGVSSARNFGISQAGGRYILPLDSDDLLGPSYLELAAAIFKKETNLTLVYCRAKKIGSENEYWELPPYTLKTLAKGNIIFSCAFFKKQDWEKMGGYDTNLVHGYEDWDFWISLLKNGGQVYQIPEVQFYYRIKNSSRNKDISEKQFEEIYIYLSKKHSDFFVDHVGSFQQLTLEIKSNREELKEMMKREKRLKENIIFKVLNKLGLLNQL